MTLKRYDERDTMFARMVYKEGTKAYKDYYSRHPERKAIDDELRNMPALCSPETPTYHPIDSKIPDANFRFLTDIRELVEGEKKPTKTSVEPEQISGRLKELTLYYGAKHVGIAKMQDYHYYSHRGRLLEYYGDEVKDLLPYGIAFTVEMKREGVEKAPLIPEIIESSRAYVEAAIIGMQLAYFIRELGYSARVHMDGNYLVIAPLVAQDAGIGVIGRHGLLITPTYGTSVRLGVVTTDLPLVPDDRFEIDIAKFCEICGVCASVCPGRAIPTGSRKFINGELRWQIEQEKCYAFWRKVGTDCGVCMKTCPFGKGIELLDLLEPEFTEHPLKLFKKYLNSSQE
ncbi:4Fe-4S dicluster domain-containing protein [Kosmotoga pacifica]|uniref:4Fe-4S dicluster domain-containing protein n=1 Tax=Kosmotoga pacifica TaxID=1330330 RepID=UPI00069C2AF9|nr:reductive dehalogenase domain-containing protein [Kosmotoga pacifica]